MRKCLRCNETGTACNVVGDGALTLMLTGVANKKNIKSDDKSFNL